MSEIVVYLDLDGVMADYDAGIRAMGFKIDPRYKNDLNRSGTKNPLKRQMYEAIKGTDFYRDLPYMPDALKLYEAVAGFGPVILTAAPKFDGNEDNYYLDPHWLGAAYHKRHWVEHRLLRDAHFPPEYTAGEIAALMADHSIKTVEVSMRPQRVAIPDDRFICTTSARKWEFMHRRHGKHQVLIDDRVDNCRTWAEHGGYAILHKSADESIAEFDAYRDRNDV